MINCPKCNSKNIIEYQKSTIKSYINTNPLKYDVKWDGEVIEYECEDCGHWFNKREYISQ